MKFRRRLCRFLLGLLLLLVVPHTAQCFVFVSSPGSYLRPLAHLREHSSRPSTTYHLSSSSFALTSATSSTSLTVRASLTLLVSAFSGLAYDYRHGNGLGTLITLLLSAHCSNLNLSPSNHMLYNFCWTRLLPTSLVLLFLASPSLEDRKSSIETIEAVSVPFFIGSIGSILGCLLSFTLCWLGADNHDRTYTNIFPGRRHWWWVPGRLLLPLEEAAVQAGCLCASFIGGPVNYFHVAKTLGYDSGVSGSLFGASVSDLLISSLYFSLSTAALSSNLLQSWFPIREPISLQRIPRKRTVLTTKRRVVAAVATAGSLAWGMVSVCKSFDERTASGMLAALGAMGSLISRILSWSFARLNLDLLDDVRVVSTPMSDICFYLLFAAIGASLNLRNAVQEGGWHFLSNCVFALTALAMHILTILVGSFLATRLFPSKLQLSVEEIMVASNAAIGGPLTAAEIGKKTSARRRRGLVVAGTVWGVFGFAIGTELGVSLSKRLLRLLAVV